ncbi:hypothetical protein KR084_006496, partial [Drosophila pseudotakahashii]
SQTAQRVKMADTNDLNGLAKLQADRHEALRATLQCFRKDAMSRKTAIYFQKRLQKVDDLKTNFLETHTRMVCTEGFEETPYYLKGLASEFEERYLEVYCSIDESYKQTHAPEPPPVTPQPLHKAEPAIRVNFPHIPVPKFSGNIIEWPGFYDAFSRLIHDNQQLSDSQRFHFLKDSLPAGRDCDIQQIQLTDANYQVA